MRRDGQGWDALPTPSADELRPDAGGDARLGHRHGQAAIGAVVRRLGDSLFNETSARPLHDDFQVQVYGWPTGH